MNRPPTSSIRRKVMRVIMLASVTVMLVTVAAFMAYDLVTFRQTLVGNLTTQARMIAENSNAALEFLDEGDAAKVLASLRTEPHLTAAALYDTQGRLFVKYPPNLTAADLPAVLQSEGHQFGSSRLTVYQPVIGSGKRVGTLFLQSNLDGLNQRIQLYGVISLLIVGGSLAFAFWLSSLLQSQITGPIVVLAETAQKISEEHDYSLRAPKVSDDELGSLTVAFNGMLERIQTSDSALRASEAQFRLVTDEASVLLAQVDREFRYKFVNQPYAARYGRRPEEVVGRHALEIVGPALFERALPFLEQALAGQRVQYELELPGPGNEGRWSHAEYTPEKNAAGEVVGLLAVHTDITLRKRTEQAVRESERRETERAQELSVVIETVPVPLIIVHDAEGRHMTGNRAAGNLVRVSEGGELSKSAPEHSKPQHFRSFKDGRELRPEELPAQRAARGEIVSDFEFDLVFDDGTVLNLLGSGTPLFDAQGRPRGAVHTLIDFTERKRQELRLARVMAQTDAQARLFDAMLSSIKDLAYTFDLEGNWTYANEALLRIWGRSLSEIVGKSSLELGYPPELAERLKQQVKEVVRTRAPIRGETYFTDAAGVEDYHEYIFSPVFAADGTVTSVCGTTRLTTERKRWERELEAARDRAVANARAKDDFLAALSHELRTPLNPVLLLASEAAEDPHLAPEVRMQFATIRNNVELEARLIDDLLDLTRITNGKLALNGQTLDVHGVLQEAVHIVRADADAKQIALKLEFCAGEPRVFGDRVRLQQVFWNVLKNAVKFTPPAGRVTVRTFVRGDGFFVQVIDTGIGLSPEELGRVFTAFAQGEHAEGGSHRFGGLGLGLAISQRLVELHAGVIQASSEGRDRGASFTIRLPACAAAHPTPEAPDPGPPTSPPLSAGGRQILLVEDHEPTRTALALLLKRRHFTVVTAASLAEARALAAQNKIDLLISDIGLPDGNGYELMNELREAYGLSGIALTGYGMEEDVQQSKRTGFVAHLTKPVRIQSLDEALAASSMPGA